MEISFTSSDLTVIVNDVSRYQAPKLASIPNFEEDFRGDVSDFKMM